jgi:hypothetical protein
LGTKPGINDVMELTDVGLKVEFVSEDKAPHYTTRILRLGSSFFLRSGSQTLSLHKPLLERRLSEPPCKIVFFSGDTKK